MNPKPEGGGKNCTGIAKKKEACDLETCKRNYLCKLNKQVTGQN